MSLESAYAYGNAFRGVSTPLWEAFFQGLGLHGMALRHE